MIEKNQHSFFSFDFFDTLATRNAGDYQRFYRQLYRHMKDKGYINGGNDFSFSEARIESERKARSISIEKHAHPEISIYEIYGVFVTQYGNFAEKDAVILADIEASFDELNLVPFSPLIHKINRLPQNILVAVVSDTFYPGDILTRFIKRIGVSRDFQVFSSCDYKTGKYSQMFEHVKRYAESNNITTEKILHLGDNYNSDVQSPARYGIHSIHLPFGDTLFWKSDELAGKYETLHCLTETNIVHGVPLRVASAKALTQLSEYDPDSTNYYSYGARELAPIYTGFIIWLHKKAIEHKEDVLLFMMREGEILADLYNSSRAFTNDAIPNNLIFVSRKVLKLAALNEVTVESIGTFFVNIKVQSFENVCEMLGISEHLQLVLDACNAERQHTVLGKTEEFTNAVIGNLILVNCIKRSALKARMSFIRHYFSALQSANVSKEFPVNVGLVDVGWNGSIQKEIGRIFFNEGIKAKISGYYLSTTLATSVCNSKIGSCSSAAYGYLFCHGSPKTYHDMFMRSPEIIEQSLTSPYKGSLIGYTTNGEPICSSKLLHEIQARQITTLQRALLDVTKVLSSQITDFEQTCDCEETINWLRSRLLRVICSPFDEEVELFKYWHHDENLATNTSDLIINSNLSFWVNACSPIQIRMTTMFEAYWLYAIFSSDLRSNPRLLLDVLSADDFYAKLSPKNNINASVLFFFGNSNKKNVPFEFGQQGFFTCDIDSSSYIDLESVAISFSGIPIGILFEIHALILTINGESHLVDINHHLTTVTSTVRVSIDTGLERCVLSSGAALFGMKGKITINIERTHKQDPLLSRVRIIIRPIDIKSFNQKDSQGES